MSFIKTYCTIILFLLSGLNFAQTKTIKHDGKERSYLVHLPPNYNSGNKYPLVLLFHGWNHTPEFTEQHTKMSIKADSSNFIVVYPVAIIGTNKEWNENNQYKIDDVGFIKELLDTLISNYSLDTTRIYAAGFSDGAGMAYRMAYELPYRIAAVAGVAGLLSGKNYSPKRATPTIQFCAKDDSDSYPYFKPVIDYWKTINTTISGPDTFFVNSGALGIRWKGDGNTEFIHYVTNSGGHSWPGGEKSWSTPTKAISASKILWDFFVAHPLGNTISDIKNERNESINDHFQLFQNYPNPFNPTTQISFNLPDAGRVNLKVYNILGEEIATLVNDVMGKGLHTVRLNMKDKPTGIYVYSVTSGKYKDSRKLLFLK